jgi:hypothetical protein
MTDTEKFRLRHFVEKLVQQGECVIHDDPIDLIDVAAVLDCNPHAVWFRAVGPEKTELVGALLPRSIPMSPAFPPPCANACGIRLPRSKCPPRKRRCTRSCSPATTPI